MSTARLLAVALAVVTGLVVCNQSQAAIIDITSLSAQGTDGTATFMQFSVDKGAGTGNIDAFLRLQGKETEVGYNTDGAVEFDTKTSVHTHSLQLSAIPEVNINGVMCREFLLDTNQNSQTISLDSVKIYLADAGDLTGYPNGFGTAIYDLGDNWVKINDGLSTGSGLGDMLMYVPSYLFGSDTSKYVYLYSGLGTKLATNGGFEEWAVASRGSFGGVPEPATMILLALGGGMILMRRKARA